MDEIRAMRIALEAAGAVNMPGTHAAIASIFSILDGINVATSGQAEQQREVARSIMTLMEALSTSTRQIVPPQLDDTVSENKYEEGYEAQAFQERVRKLVSTLQEVHEMLRRNHSRGALTRFLRATVYAENEAKTLVRVRKRIDDATNQFRLEGELSVQQLLPEAVKRSQDVLMHLERERDLESLNRLQPLNASYKSYLTEPKSCLHLETRKSIRTDLTEWFMQPDQRNRVFILHGRVGTGKSSIAHEFVSRLDQEHITASFFFDQRHSECGGAYSLFPTLTYQLAHAGTRQLLQPMVKAARTYMTSEKGPPHTLSFQLQQLLINPLRKFERLSPGLSLREDPTNHPIPPMLIVVDDVDRCSNDAHNKVPEILHLLCKASSQFPFIRILVTSRPTTPFMAAVQLINHQTADSIALLRDLDHERDTHDDIGRFIRTQGAEWTYRGQSTLTEIRPGAAQQLEKLSEGLFLYTSVVVRALDHDQHYAVSAYDSLIKSGGSQNFPEIFQELDIRYSQVLDSAFSTFRNYPIRMNDIRQVLTWFTLAVEAVSPGDLGFVHIPSHATMDVIERLRSVLIIDGPVSITTKMKAYHRSFPQFLVHSARCRDPAYYIEPHTGHALIANSLLELLVRKYVIDMHIDGELPWMWWYANTCWADHIIEAQHTDELRHSLLVFAWTHLGDWISDSRPWRNVCSSRPSAVDKLVRVRDWCQKNGNSKDEVILLINGVVDQRVKELVEAASQEPDTFDKDEVHRINGWAENGYTAI